MQATVHNKRKKFQLAAQYIINYTFGSSMMACTATDPRQLQPHAWVDCLSISHDECRPYHNVSVLAASEDLWAITNMHYRWKRLHEKFQTFQSYTIHKVQY